MATHRAAHSSAQDLTGGPLREEICDWIWESENQFTE